MTTEYLMLLALLTAITRIGSGDLLGCPFMVGQRLKSKRPGWHGKEDIEEVTAVFENSIETKLIESCDDTAVRTTGKITCFRSGWKNYYAA